jgi:hypothetical protein
MCQEETELMISRGGLGTSTEWCCIMWAMSDGQEKELKVGPSHSGSRRLVLDCGQHPQTKLIWGGLCQK